MKVWFEGGFWDSKGQDRSGIEMPIQRRFDWNGQTVYVPSVYSCAKGLVIDICVEISTDEIHAFMEKWNLSTENDGSEFTDEKRMLAERENPLHIPFSPTGERVAFIHPKTGQQHYLTVQGYERLQIPVEGFGEETFEYPNHYIAMSYTFHNNRRRSCETLQAIEEKIDKAHVKS